MNCLATIKPPQRDKRERTPMQPALERPAKAERCSALHADTPTRRYAPRRGPVNQSPSLRYSPKKSPLLLLRSAHRGLPASSLSRCLHQAVELGSGPKAPPFTFHLSPYLRYPACSIVRSAAFWLSFIVSSIDVLPVIMPATFCPTLVPND